MSQLPSLIVSNTVVKNFRGARGVCGAGLRRSAANVPVGADTRAHVSRLCFDEPGGGLRSKPGAKIDSAANSISVPILTVALVETRLRHHNFLRDLSIYRASGSAVAPPSRTAPMAETVYLVDSFSLIFQVFHAIPPMTSPAGQPTNAVFGFSRDLVTLLKDHRPGWLICAWDSSGPGERLGIFPDYKANRAEMPEDLRPQIGLVREVIEAFRIPLIEFPGWEADDVIATLTREAVEHGRDVRIVTSDKDARQLLGPQVKLFNFRKNSYLDETGLLEDWGVRPDQVVDFQSLVGDAVDNVPGIPLIGPKKAAQLLKDWQTLEDVLANAEHAPGAKLRENLKKFADQARMSRELVRLRTDLPLVFDWEASRCTQPDVHHLQDVFRRLGFRKLVDDVKQFAPPVAKVVARGLFDDEPESEPAPQPEHPGQVAQDRCWETVDTPEKLTAFVTELSSQSRFCVDLETTGLDPLQSRIVGWAFSWTAGTGHYLPVLGPAGSQLLNHDDVLRSLQPILEREDIEVINQNIKFDLIVLRAAGIRIRNLGLDPMVGDYLLDAGARSHNLETLIDKYLHRPSISIKELIGSGAKQKRMDEIAVEKVAEYATEDADCSLQIADLIRPQLEADHLWKLYWDLERPLIHVLADMEYRGIRVDAAELRAQSETLTLQLETLMHEIHDLAGHPFNIDSPIQLRTVLFEEQGLPVRKKTKTGPSTDQDVLEELATLRPDNPLPLKIIEHRQMSKLKGTYLDALPALINPQTGRIHASFNQVVAATGRLSSSDPNLQNIPIRTPAGRQVRKAFVPENPDWRLVCADYSQIELRMLAHFSRDPVLVEAFANGVDIHTAVAADVFGVDRQDVDSDMRRVAKAVNFGVIYGQSPYGLAAALGITQDDAARFIDEYFSRYAGVDAFLDQTLVECAKTGYARTILGRRRAIEGLRSERSRNRTMPERTAINTVIQGSAADLIKQAMIRVHNRLERDQHPARLLLQIHDELVLESPVDAVPSLVALVKAEMEHALTLDVPLIVDVSVGQNWLDIEDVES
ncbi:DNA polymerase I [Planctellipticum variicoloris]|uniref:DNA polymerase I n=1 Tax=Planctellipticum variicoloris TaxID=3064265 RepID=UPI003013C0BF|nr:DNA polymerase I [Planctomycetaceae bacterium SH412]